MEEKETIKKNSFLVEHLKYTVQALSKGDTYDALMEMGITLMALARVVKDEDEKIQKQNSEMENS